VVTNGAAAVRSAAVAGRHRRRCAHPPNRDRADGTGPAGTHAYETAFWGGRCLVPSAPPREGVVRLAAMRACGGRAATVGPVEEGEGRSPCRASAHAACPSPCRADNSAGRGAAAGDAPDRRCGSLAMQGIPEAEWSWTTPAARRRRRTLSRWRRRIKGVFDAIGVGGATGRHRRRRPIPPNRDRVDATGPAGTHAYGTAFWRGRGLITSAPPREGAGRLAAMRACGGRAAAVGPVEEGEGRRPCRASAHAACPSPCRGDNHAGRGAAAGDAPERGCRSLAMRGIPEDRRSREATTGLRRRRRQWAGRRRVKGVADVIRVVGTTGGDRRRRHLPPNGDRADGPGTAGTHGDEPALWDGR